MGKKRRKGESAPADPVEEKNINYLQRRYLYETRRALYVANEEVNQVWDASDITDFIAAWENGDSLEVMAEYFGAERWELILLAADLMNRGKIKGDVIFIREGAPNV